MVDATRFTNVEVTGTLKVGGIEEVGPAEEAASTPTKTEFNNLVAVVNNIIEMLGGDTSGS